jgi:hypothetical protein
MNNRVNAFQIAVLLVCFSIVGAKASDDVDLAQGTIQVHFSNGALGWTYEISPQHSSVRLVAEENVSTQSGAIVPPPAQNNLGPYVYCDKSPTIVSPDKAYVAECSVSSKRRDELFVSRAQSSLRQFEWKTTHWRGVDAFAWSANSQWLAILNHSEHYSMSPVGVVSGLSGHPIPYSAVYLDLVNIRTGHVSEYLVRKHVKYLLFPTIVRWSE